MPSSATWFSTLIALGLGAVIWWQLCRRNQFEVGNPLSLFSVLLTLGVVCRLAYLCLTPVFYAPDEQAHFY